jgi:hypothetical protein
MYKQILFSFLVNDFLSTKKMVFCFIVYKRNAAEIKPAAFLFGVNQIRNNVLGALINGRSTIWWRPAPAMDWMASDPRGPHRHSSLFRSS